MTTAIEHFKKLIEEQLARVERMKADTEFTDYASLDKLIVGVCGGDGIGPVISKESARVLEFLLADEVAAGKVELRSSSTKDEHGIPAAPVLHNQIQC